MTDFFVPDVDGLPGDPEERYQELARRAGAVAPPHGERIRTVAFTSDREEWTATVGQTMRGTTSKGERLRPGPEVVAIFPTLTSAALPDRFTDRANATEIVVFRPGTQGEWQNPAMIRGRQHEYFAAPAEAEAEDAQGVEMSEEVNPL